MTAAANCSRPDIVVEDHDDDGLDHARISTRRQKEDGLVGQSDATKQVTLKKPPGTLPLNTHQQNSHSRQAGLQMTLSVPRYVLLNRRHSADLFTRGAGLG